MRKKRFTKLEKLCFVDTPNHRFTASIHATATHYNLLVLLKLYGFHVILKLLGISETNFARS